MYQIVEYNWGKMFTFLVILTIVFVTVLLLASAVEPKRSLYSMSELKRRAKHSAAAKAELSREKLVPAVEALFGIKVALLLTITTILLIITFGWVLGVVLAIVVSVVYGPLSANAHVKKIAGKLYAKFEPYSLRFIRKFPRLFFALSEKPRVDERRIDSKEEFQELIARSTGVLTDIERNAIVHALDFSDKKVTSLMTRKTDIDFIKREEFLGPLVLDELHSLGHSRLPVVDKNLNHIVGILNLRDLLSLDIKRSATAEKVMDTHVYYISHNETLEDALAAFLKNRHHMLIVVNDELETMGLLTIEDTIAAYMGREIVGKALAPTDI